MNTRSLFLLCLITFFLRALISALLPLGNDEAYYIMYGRFPDYNYYDHPLMIGWAIKFSTFNFTFQHPFFYRLPATLLSIPTTIFIYRIARLISSPKAGWIAACIFSCSFYGSVIAGIFAMPDSIMVFFWSLSLLIATHIFIADKYNSYVKNELLLWFSLVVGLAMLAKIHAAFLWISVIVFAIFQQRDLFKKWEFWVGMVITSLSIMPILLWNYQNEWVHFSFYASRVGVQKNIHVDQFLKEFLGEIAYQGPIVFFIILFFGFFRMNKFGKRKAKIFLMCMAFPLIFFIWTLSIFRETLPHWTGPAYISLIVLSSISMAEIVQFKKVNLWLRGSFSFMLLMLTAGMLLIFYYPGTIGSTKEVKYYGKGDFTLDMYGWGKSGSEIAAFIEQQNLKTIPIYSHRWFPAAHIDEYIARKSGNTFFAVGAVEQIHQYKWINARRGGVPNSDSALFITPSNIYADPNQLYGKDFHTIELIEQIPQNRRGHLTRYFYVYLMRQRIQKSF